MYCQQCMLAHICHAYMSICTLIHLLQLHIEIGSTQTSEGKERFPASCMIYLDHFWQPGPFLATNHERALFYTSIIPFPIRKAVEQEIHPLVEQNVLEHVDSAITPIEWASPIVCVPKYSVGIRIFKATVNPQVYVDPHP